MSASDQYDVVVIGAGPGGYIAAIRCAQLGLRVAIVERDELGGVCLNWGCIPTKTLLRSAEVFRLAQQAEQFGVRIAQPTVDLKAMVARSRQVAGQLAQGVKFLLNKNKVEHLKGSARLISPHDIAIDGSEGSYQVQAHHIILATGARARKPAHFPDDPKRVWTAREAMTPKDLPKSLLVIGSGAIGLEFASMYRDLGSAVTLVEMADKIAPREDDDVSEAISKALAERGVRLQAQTSVDRLEVERTGVRAFLKHNSETKEETFSHVLLAIGVSANVEGLWDSEVGIDMADNGLVTNPYCQTSIPHIYAIGDIAGAPWLAHKASREGVIAAEHIAGQNPEPLMVERIPSCTYCHPQIASIGLTEREARAQGFDVKVGKASFSSNGKALAYGESDGFVKTIFESKTGEVLGAHVIGHDATEQIHQFAISMAGEITDEELQTLVFAHPTLSETIHESVLHATDQALNS